MAKSLMDGMEEHVPAKAAKNRGGGGSSMDTAKIAKLAGVGVMLLAAVLLLAWNFGIIGGPPEPEPLTPEQIQQAEQEMEEQLERERPIIEHPDITPAGIG